jgi:hypothetical protein
MNLRQFDPYHTFHQTPNFPKARPMLNFLPPLFCHVKKYNLLLMDLLCFGRPFYEPLRAGNVNSETIDFIGFAQKNAALFF